MNYRPNIDEEEEKNQYYINKSTQKHMSDGKFVIQADKQSQFRLSKKASRTNRIYSIAVSSLRWQRHAICK